MTEGRIVKVSGPLVIAEGMREANMFDVVRVGEANLIGEIIEMHGDRASIQVYEETAGLGRGDRVVSTGAPLSVELGPGLMENIYDGIQRPLVAIKNAVGPNITRGVDLPALDREKKWYFEATAKRGDRVVGGDVYGVVKENEVVRHKIMAPPGTDGTIEELLSGYYTVTDPIGKLSRPDGTVENIIMMQKWPVRVARPYKEKLPPNEPLITGQRNVDSMFPVAKGGTACIPGPFGSGKTVVQHQLAKWSDADFVIYIGCGERGIRDDGRSARIPRDRGPKDGLVAHQAHRPHREHVRYAGRGARGVRLHRHHDSGISARHGLLRRRHRGLDVTLGGGSA